MIEKIINNVPRQMTPVIDPSTIQYKTLSMPITVDGSQQVNVEGTLNALNNLGTIAKIQLISLPTASAEYENKIYQYVGESGNGLVKGYFYICTEDLENPGSYLWVPKSVQSASGAAGDYIKQYSNLSLAVDEKETGEWVLYCGTNEVSSGTEKIEPGDMVKWHASSSSWRPWKGHFRLIANNHNLTYYGDVTNSISAFYWWFTLPQSAVGRIVTARFWCQPNGGRAYNAPVSCSYSISNGTGASNIAQTIGGGNVPGSTATYNKPAGGAILPFSYASRSSFCAVWNPRNNTTGNVTIASNFGVDFEWYPWRSEGGHG